VRGYVDLHSHFLPGVDDGAQMLDDSLAICRGLFEIGFDTVIATPHIRSAMFENTKAGLSEAYETFYASVADQSGLPKTGLAAEYFCNDLFWQLVESGELLTYPIADTYANKQRQTQKRQRSVLVETSYDQLPVRIEHRFFQMIVRNVYPALAHPERYFFLHRDTKPIDRMLESGMLAIMDVKALTGRHGKKTKRAAERMLDEGVYFAVSSDAHRPEDVELVAEGIERLESLVGEEESRDLLAENPARILEGYIG
jgi:protein-tyrosine phosphatase